MTLTHQGIRLYHPVHRAAEGAVMRVVVEGVRNSEDLADQVGPEDLEEVTQIQAATHLPYRRTDHAPAFKRQQQAMHVLWRLPSAALRRLGR